MNDWEEFPLGDSSHLVGIDQSLLWTSSCIGVSVALRLKGPFRIFEDTPNRANSAKNYLGALATRTGISFDSGSTRSQILSTKGGITFSVDDVDQKELRSILPDSVWIQVARGVAHSGIQKSFPNSKEGAWTSNRGGSFPWPAGEDRFR